MLPTQLSSISSYRTFCVPSPYEAADWESLECNSGVCGPLEHRNCYFNAAAFSIKNIHCVVAGRPHKEFMSHMDAFWFSKKALIRIKICGCRCWLDLGWSSSHSAWSSFINTKKGSSYDEANLLSILFYQIKSCWSEINAYIRNFPRTPNNLQTQMNPHTGKPFNFPYHNIFPISAAALSLSSGRDWYQYCDATWIKNNCRNQQLISAPSPALGERTYFPFPCLLTRTNVI